MIKGMVSRMAKKKKKAAKKTTMSHPQRKKRRQEIAAFIKGGGKPDAAMKKFSVSYSIVKSACMEAGVPFGRSVTGKRGKPVQSTTYMVLADLIHDVDTMQVIGDRHDMTKQNVHIIKTLSLIHI